MEKKRCEEDDKSHLVLMKYTNSNSVWACSALVAHLLSMRKVHILDSKAYDFPPSEKCFKCGGKVLYT